MSKNIFITRQIPDRAIQILEEKGYSVDVNKSDKIPTQKQIIKFLQKKSYDAVITLLTDIIDEKVFSSIPSVKIYANYASGYDNINISDAKKYNITVTNAPGSFATDAVAQHTFTLILALSRRIVEADKFVRDNKYYGWSPMNFTGTDIFEKTLGLIGAGHIGLRVAMYCKRFGMKIVYTDIVRNQYMEKEYQATFYDSVDEVIKNADIISLHVPLLESTKHLINREKLNLMKPNSLLINTSRGQIIDEKILEEVLENKLITGAALDVFEFEPKISRRLRKLQNVILTPHIASASEKARNQMAEIAAYNLIDFFEGKTPRNIINN